MSRFFFSEEDGGVQISIVYAQSAFGYGSAVYRRYPQNVPRYSSPPTKTDVPDHPHRTCNRAARQAIFRMRGNRPASPDRRQTAMLTDRRAD